MKKSANSFNFLFIVLAVIFQALSGVFAKYASMTMTEVSLWLILTNPYYILSIICLIFQALVWMQALKKYDLTFAYPFIGLTSLIILGLSFVLFNEQVHISNIIGLLIVLTGIYLISSEASKA